MVSASVSWKAEGGDGGPQSPACVPLPLQSSNWEGFVSCLCHRRGHVSLTGLGNHRYRYFSKSQVKSCPFSLQLPDPAAGCTAFAGHHS